MICQLLICYGAKEQGLVVQANKNALQEQLNAEGGSGWRAHLDLQFKYEVERSYLAYRQHVGPLRVQRPFYPEGSSEACHVYLLHPPGGVVGGDALQINVDVEQAAHALITTPAAGKFYRSAGSYAKQQQNLTVAQGAVLEWLPQENIVFSGAKVEMATRVELAPQARFIGCDISCMGRVSSGKPFVAGKFNSRFEVWQQGRPLYIERTLFDSESEIMHARWGMAGYSVVGSLLCTGEYPTLVEEVRAHVKHKVRLLDSNYLFTVTQHSGGLLCRYLGHYGEDAKACFAAALECIRPKVLGREFHRPRIWDT